MHRSVRKLTLALAVVAVLASGTVFGLSPSVAATGHAPRAAAAQQTRVYHRCDAKPPAVAPGKILLACADANAWYRRLDWADWRRLSASGDGVFWANDCKPSCAEGTFHSWPVHVRLTRVWATGGYKVFHRVDYHFTGKRKPSWLPWKGHARLPT